MSDCIFCKIISGEIPSKKLYEDDLCYAFYDIAPQSDVHFLVVPKEHISCAKEINGGNSSVISHIFEVIAKLASELKLDSYRIRRKTCISCETPTCRYRIFNASCIDSVVRSQ